MKHEAFPSPEHIEGRFASVPVALGVSRVLLANTAQYATYIEARGLEAVQDVIAYDEAAGDLLKHFYELASAQMAEPVIDQRLFPDGAVTEPAKVLGAMDEILASWQRGGIVVSQQEPLHEFALWLLDTQRAFVDEVEDDTLRRRIERGIDTAEKRLAKN